jgi:hypothetical protein
MFTNRVRLPIIFSKPQFPVEKTSFRKADGSTKVLSTVIRNTYEGKTDQLPEEWHRKLVIALSHDTVTIENERLMSGIVLTGDYGIDHQDFLQYPLAQASFTVDVTPFDATNSNCQTCEEATQLNLVDDQTDEVWGEGTTNIFPDVLTDNDEICCNPYTIELIRFNTNYFSAASISADGVLTATVIDPAPVVDDVLIATYRVTCSNGQYDEADVYGNITGSDTDFCYPPGGTGAIYVPTGNSTTAEISLDVIPPIDQIPACWYVWELFLTSDLGTIIQSGAFPMIGDLTITGLTPGVSYTISIKGDCCGYNYSLPVSIEFTITAFAGDTCGNFQVVYLPSIDPVPQSISYMNCAGEIVNLELSVAQTTIIPMLILAGETDPLYYVASSADISITYVGLYI